jgi:DNA repair protein RadC
MEIKEGAEVKMPNDAIKAAGDDIKDELQECLLVLGLNVKNKICYKDLVAKGSINHLQAVPAPVAQGSAVLFTAYKSKIPKENKYENTVSYVARVRR